MLSTPENRLEGISRPLVERTHNAGLKLIIDIVPNHVARNYQSLTNPEGTKDFGASDDKTVVYDVNNNFYYNPGEAFQVPEWLTDYKPLNGESHTFIQTVSLMKFPQNGQVMGSRLSRPRMGDWYETVKVNYGITPEGQKDFDELPEGFEYEDYTKHFEFWSDKTIPDSWKKFRGYCFVLDRIRC